MNLECLSKEVDLNNLYSAAGSTVKPSSYLLANNNNIHGNIEDESFTYDEENHSKTQIVQPIKSVKIREGIPKAASIRLNLEEQNEDLDQFDVIEHADAVPMNGSLTDTYGNNNRLSKYY